MSAKRLGSIAVIACVALVSSVSKPVLAWKSECSLTPPGSPEQLICQDAECVNPELDGPRGYLFGEHALIARQAMELVGLQDYTDTQVLVYLGTGDIVAGSFVSVEPGGIGTMVETVSRVTTIPAFSQVPDFSYGLADFILGNEHCFVQNTLFGIRNLPQLCHSYATHLGPLNSTHFPPQARAVYEGYHKLALDTAVRCAELAEAIDSMSASIALPDSAPSGSEVTFPNEDLLRNEVIKQCELEALTIEAVGAHYSSDAWSMGHMWERWGAPILATSVEGQARQFAAALQAGLIHGAREFLDDHDQMNAPGPWVPQTGSADPAKDREVRFHSGNATLPGAGDAYLLECTSQRPIDDPDSPFAFYSESMLGSPSLQEAKSLMLSCVARGFQEVYEAGPRTSGDLPLSPALHPAIQSSLSGRCWNLRADNLSMWLGAGISSWPASRDPAFWSGASAVAGLFVGTLYEGSPLVESDGLLAETEVLYTTLQLLAEWFPGGSQAASFTPPFLGLGRNSFAVSQIQSGLVAQLDRFDRDAWATSPTGFGCDDDGGCAPNEYCQIELDSDGTELRSCVEKEIGILRAFRRGELRTWCEASKVEDLQRAAMLCERSLDTGAGDGAECDACAELVLPHMRNACDEGSYDPEVTGRPALLADEPPYFDHRSMCDIAAPLLAGDPVVVYAAYDPDRAEQGTALEAARSLCESGFIDTDPIAYEFDDAPPPLDEALSIDEVTLQEERSTCGAAGEVHWFRFTHDPDLGHVHQLLLTASPLIDSNDQSHTAEIDELRIELFSGDDCEVPGPPAALRDTDQDGVVDAWAIPWETGPERPNEICIRVSSREYDTWTNYVLSEGTAEAGNAAFMLVNQDVTANAKVSWPIFVVGQTVRRQRGEAYTCNQFGFRRTSWDDQYGQPNNVTETFGPECDPVGGISFNVGAAATLAAEGSGGSGSGSASILVSVVPGQVRMSGNVDGMGVVGCDLDPATYCSAYLFGEGSINSHLGVVLAEDAEVEISYDACGEYHVAASRAIAEVTIHLPQGNVFVGYGGNPAFPCQGVETWTLPEGTSLGIESFALAQGATSLEGELLEPSPNFEASRSRSSSVTVTFRSLNP